MKVSYKPIIIGALGIQEPVIPGEPLIKRQPMVHFFFDLALSILAVTSQH